MNTINCGLSTVNRGPFLSTVDSRFLVELQPLIPLRIIKKLNKN